MNDWDILGCQPTDDLRELRGAYAKALRLHPPESDPEGFMRLRESYERLQQRLKHGATGRGRRIPNLRVELEEQNLKKSGKPSFHLPPLHGRGAAQNPAWTRPWGSHPLAGSADLHTVDGVVDALWEEFVRMRSVKQRWAWLGLVTMGLYSPPWVNFLWQKRMRDPDVLDEFEIRVLALILDLREGRSREHVPLVLVAALANRFRWTSQGYFSLTGEDVSRKERIRSRFGAENYAKATLWRIYSRTLIVLPFVVGCLVGIRIFGLPFSQY